MLSMSIQPSVKSILTCGDFCFKTPLLPPSMKPKASSLHSFTNFDLRITKRTIERLPSPKTAAELAPVETIDEISEKPQKLGVDVKSVAKPRLVLKFIWMEKNIGLGLDQIIPGHGPVPLSPYFFWPRKDAWEELKTTLESKPWISQKKMIILLNQATDIINLWQQSGGNLS
ncbi:hypothetical protein RD792_005796 [Penstemon davidsonii]|uniref:Uncharacterized protein n=1 Tax=Penstemon davidsonii TaxID=160366 RepID=A0ABR0DE90_9LAMI|nr:hypothetical protein RD792_005796 [Penstemon davidsonii]